jgi:ABC-type multidrug transport system ATPase subunit
MILDEPGEGLDAQNAKVFAQGVKQVADRLGYVILTTHNPYVLSEFGHDDIVRVVKHKGVSRVV